MTHISDPYAARNTAAITLAHLALMTDGWSACRGRDEDAAYCKDVLYITTPLGQMSYHLAPEDADVLASIPLDTAIEWDGKFNGQDLSFADKHKELRNGY